MSQSPSPLPGLVVFCAIVLGYVGYRSVTRAPSDLDSPVAITSAPTQDDGVSLDLKVKPASVEYKVACIEAGTAVDLDDPEVRRLGEDLDALQKRFGKSRIQISDAFVKAHDLLVERGYRDLNIADIMEQTPREAPPGMMDLNGLLAMYVIEKTSKS